MRKSRKYSFKKYGKLTAAVLLVFITLAVGKLSLAAEVEIGGEMKTILSGTQLEDASLQQILNLDFLFPEYGNIEPRLEMDLKYNVADLSSAEDGEFDYFLKKLYLKQRFEKLHLTLGRQPISWSFGSLINPVDYNLGAVVMDEETGGKFVDAVETYLPINWDSSLALVASSSENYLEPKWGLRGRTGYRGYDLSFNYIREPEQEIGISGVVSKINPADRLGFSAKGDLGPVGVYGAVSYYREKSGSLENTTYLLGTDYSYYLNYSNKLSLQLEYLRTDITNLLSLLHIPSVNLDQNQLNLLIAHIGYQIDDFSQLGLIMAGSLDDGSWLLTPTYQNQLSNNLLLNLSYHLSLGQENSLYGPLMPRGIAEVSISYPF